MDQRPSGHAPHPKSPFDPRPAQVEQWIKELPLANLGESSRRLYEALRSIQTLVLPAEQRFRLLEQLRPPIDTVLDAMKVHYVGKPFPLADKSRQTVALAQVLMQQMAQGYRNTLATGGKHLTLATQRGLIYLGHMLLRAYQVYAPYPVGVWREIHDLYRQAEARGDAQSPLKEPAADSDCNRTIENTYKHILLLALACPYRLRQGEVERIDAWLCNWAQHATLSRLAATRNPSGMFVTNFNTDDPPTYLVLRATEYNPESCRLLNAARLADAIRDTLGRQRREEGNKAQHINDHALRRLMLAWGVMPKRRFSRTQKHSTAVVAMGLSTAHYFIGGESAFAQMGDSAANPLFNNPAQFGTSETADRHGQLPDMWEMTDIHLVRDAQPNAADAHNIEFTPGHDPFALKPREKSSTQPVYQTHLWKMVNVSAGGYRLLWDNHENSQAQVGELLGLRESHDPDSFHLSLGVVRWMKCDTELGLELGVEMLSPGAIAIGTKMHRINGSSEYLRSLLLPAIKTLGQPATLLTPALPYHVGDILMVSSHGQEARVELTKLMENTGSFAQYQFRPLDSQSAAVSATDTPAHKTDDFAALWSQL
ncbi:MAG: hypothetical protein HY941_00430 [Gammaproteobacteria bacterium]|nr:hypothetical protein [Gammaproteobacteria bacterium]